MALAAACLAVVPPLVLPASTLSQVGVTVGANQPSAWADWNYSGYERKPDYPEYHAVIQMMAKVGADQGCGRAMWEYDPSLNRFGTTMSLMLLPYWTNGCVDSMEGLLFESASTTPFHFINQNELSVNPSDAVVGLPYGGLNVPLGHRAPPAAGGAVLPGLLDHGGDGGRRRPEPDRGGLQRAVEHQLQRRGPRHHLEGLRGGGLVPGAAPGRPAGGVEGGVAQPDQLAGPGGQLVRRSHPVERGARRRRPGGLAPGAGRARPDPPAVPEPATTVSHVVQTDSSISFHVDRVGTPVEVKVSYFPNWKATGADGPWRVAPNLMVVVPTSHDVTLHYGSSPADEIGQADLAAGPGGRRWPLAVAGRRCQAGPGSGPAAAAAHRALSGRGRPPAPWACSRCPPCSSPAPACPSTCSRPATGP